jgi:hypothetical protein
MSYGPMKTEFDVKYCIITADSPVCVISQEYHAANIVLSIQVFNHVVRISRY